MTSERKDWQGLELSGGRYVVERMLGKGGMGYVYLAHDRNVDRPVVLKVPRRNMFQDPKFAARFEREIRSLSRLPHPNICPILDVGEHGGLPFAVLLYLGGGNLDQRCRRGGARHPVPPVEIASWLSPVCAAIDFIHQQGFIHRDIKPANILFDEHDHVFLSDFGIAKVLAVESGDSGHSSITASGMILGTAGYMAPEVATGENLDGRADQYSLGSTLYELVVGRRAFPGKNPAEVVTRQLKDNLPPAAEVEPSVPGSVSDIIAQAMSLRPELRFASCGQLAAEYQQAVAELAAAQPPVAPQDRAGHDQDSMETVLESPAAGLGASGDSPAEDRPATFAAVESAEFAPPRGEDDADAGTPADKPPDAEPDAERAPPTLATGPSAETSEGELFDTGADSPPPLPAAAQLGCPHCGTEMTIYEVQGGRRVNCAGCNRWLIVADDLSGLQIGPPPRRSV